MYSVYLYYIGQYAEVSWSVLGCGLDEGVIDGTLL